MLITLLWHRRTPDPFLAPDAVARRLEERFAPLFEERVAARVRSVGEAHLAWLELPVKGWRSPRSEERVDGAESGARFALALDYPVGARRALAGVGKPVAQGEPLLLALAESLAEDPEPLLRELAPPFSLIWDDGAGAMRLQTDGLGQSQLFEHDGPSCFAVTNRIAALSVLGIPLEPVAEEWAVRFTLEWFPDHSSGYRGVSLLPSGSQLRLDAGGVHRTRNDVIHGWVHPPAMEREEIFELAAAGLRNHLADAMEHWERPSVGLSGGHVV